MGREVCQMPVTQANEVFRKTTETFKAGAKTLPQRYFISPEILAEEQESIFSTQWVLVGHQSQIAKAGDYFTTEVAGESLIIVRDKRGTIHGFYNVCRHRGSRLIENTNGQSAAIQCPYHAWTYSLDGRLIGAPHMDEVPSFDKADYSLHAVNLAVWEGFIFVNLSDSPTPLDKWFAPLAGKFSHWNLPKLRSAKRIDYDVQANWKLIFENYSECYHCPSVHPTLSKLSPYDSAENDLTEGPFLGGFMRITKGNSLTMSGKSCALSVGDFGEEDFHRVFYYSIFPNMLLSLHPDYVMVHQLRPLSPDRTLILCDWFFHPEAFEREDFKPEDAIEFWDMTNKQDWHVCELSQQGIASRAYEPGPYSPRESIPAAWDRYYLRFIN
jgi:phenylpropionate dioxygenase-like ring-hydroxylating dioxygenase large terminal subunit